MDRLEPKDFLKNRYIALWGLLAFQAGCINSLGFLVCRRFVSHVTGFGTQVGISLADSRYWYALELFNAPLCFILGAWVSGYLTVARRSHGLAPRYDIVTLMIPSILLTLMTAGLFGLFGTFGGTLEFNQDVILLSSLTFLCGIQNACFTTLTQGQIRTTHLTGISTDIGTDLALSINGQLSPDERTMSIRRNIMRTITFSSFSTGALLSAVIDSILQYWSFAIPLTTSLIVAGIFVKSKYRLPIPMKA